MRLLTKMSVRFQEGTKEYDGMNPVNHILDDMVYAYFNDKKANATSLRQCLQHHEKFSFLTDSHFEQLMEKTKKLVLKMIYLRGNEYIPVLPCGGGRGQNLQHIHLPHFQRFQKLLSQVYYDLRST